jgi:hypothetical protein
MCVNLKVFDFYFIFAFEDLSDFYNLQASVLHHVDVHTSTVSLNFRILAIISLVTAFWFFIFNNVDLCHKCTLPHCLWLLAILISLSSAKIKDVKPQFIHPSNNNVGPKLFEESSLSSILIRSMCTHTVAFANVNLLFDFYLFHCLLPIDKLTCGKNILFIIFGKFFPNEKSVYEILTLISLLIVFGSFILKNDCLELLLLISAFQHQHLSLDFAVLS